MKQPERGSVRERAEAALGGRENTSGTPLRLIDFVNQLDPTRPTLLNRLRFDRSLGQARQR